MGPFPIFLSIVIVVRNQSAELRDALTKTTRVVGKLVTDYEIIVIDNASTDDSFAQLKALTREGGIPNVQVFTLTREVDRDTASWAGLENALGDFVAVVDPRTDDVGVLPEMVEKSVGGAEIVIGTNQQKPSQSLGYRVFRAMFNRLYRWSNEAHVEQDSSQYRIVSRRVINFILQYPIPPIMYRHLLAAGGFARAQITYSAPTAATLEKRRLGTNIDRGMRLFASTTRAPMRLVTTLSFFGAGANVLYSAYVIAIFFLKKDVAPGWVTLSLQMSGMFFLISLVLLVLGEYILHMARLSTEGPLYYVAQELTSAVMTRKQRLNIEDTRTRPSQSRIPSHVT